MFQRLVRVILTASVDGFTGAIGRAQSVFGTFMGTISRPGVLVSQALQGIESGIRLIQQAIHAATQAWDSFIGQQVQIERSRNILEQITQSGDVTAQIMEDLARRQTEYGISIADSLPATIQFAQGLRAIDGSVDPVKLGRLNDLLAAFSAQRPDVPIDRAARALTNALAGNFTSFQQVFDVNPDIIKNLSDTARELLNSGQQAQEQALGSVTRLGTDATSASGDALAAIEEILGAIGVSADSLDVYAQDTQGMLDRVTGYWNDFKQQVASDVLPVIGDALEELLNFLEENPEAITELAEALSNLVTTGLREMIEILGGFDAANAAENIHKLAQSINDFAEALSHLNEFLTTPIAQGTAFGDFLGSIKEAGGTPGIGQQAGQQTRQGLLNFGQNTGLFGGLNQLAQDLNIHIDLNTDLFNAHVENSAAQAANQAVGDLVTSTVQRSNKGAGH